MINKRHLPTWMQDLKYLWWAFGFSTLLTTIPMYVVLVVWEERHALGLGLRQAWDLMTYNVKEETDD